MFYNHQPRELPLTHLAGDTLDVIDVWETIQGEGPYAGCPAVFVRFAGCNLQCPACDTQYTDGRQTLTVEELIARVTAFKPPLVVLTGGEPLRQNVGPLCRRLMPLKRIQIETNGSFCPDLPWAALDVVCSPKTPAIASRLLHRITAYKYVIDADWVNTLNGLPLDILGDTSHPPAYPPIGFDPTRVFVQPKDDGMFAVHNRNLQAAAKSCMKYGYRLGVQMHKLAGLP